jgi:predicted transcriptional regulator of viral defense system
MATPVTPLRKKVLNLMKDEGAQTIDDLVKKLSMSNGSARSILVKMKESGIIERVGHGTYNIPESDSD